MRNQSQFALPLGQTEIPEQKLRAAYERTRLRQSFEEAMQIEHFRICLKRLAMLAEAPKRRKRK